MMKKNLLLTICLFWSLISFGQDIQYSQFYAAPLYLNPALVGTSPQHRANLNFRDQWAAIPGAFVSYSVSYDVNIAEANSGLGFYFNNDRAGSGGLSNTMAGAMYAYDIHLSRKYAVRPAIGLGFGTRSVDINKLRFGDQLLTGGSQSVQSNFGGEQVSYFDISAGVIFYSNEFWVGYSVYHLNNPNNSLMGQENNLDRRHSLHVGYTLPMKRTVKKTVVRSITITANYKAQNEWDQFDIGAYIYNKPMVFGVWYRGIPGLKSYKPGYQNNDALVILAGLHYKKIKMCYSYDVTISKIWSRSGGSHEISLIYEHINPRKKRKRKRVKLACPSF